RNLSQTALEEMGSHVALGRTAQQRQLLLRAPPRTVSRLVARHVLGVLAAGTGRTRSWRTAVFTGVAVVPAPGGLTYSPAYVLCPRPVPGSDDGGLDSLCRTGSRGCGARDEGSPIRPSDGADGHRWPARSLARPSSADAAHSRSGLARTVRGAVPTTVRRGGSSP